MIPLHHATPAAINGAVPFLNFGGDAESLAYTPQQV